MAPLCGWGAGTYAALQALALSRSGCEVHLFSDAPELLTRGPEHFPGVVLHRVDARAGDPSLPGFDNEHFRYSLAVMRAIRNTHTVSPFDVVEFPDVGAEGYFTLRARQGGEFDGVTFALRLHLCDHQIRSMNRWPWEDRWLASLRSMETFCISQSDVLLAPSQFVANLAAQSAPESRSRIEILRYPFSDELMKSAEEQVPSARPRIMYTGRLERRKGVHDFIAAAVSVLDAGVDADFTMIGSDTPTAPGAQSMLRHLEKRIPAKHRARFEFIASQLPRHEVASRLRSSALCCFPAEADNFPFSMLEAMHERCAIVTTDGCGVHEILQDGRDALVVRRGDVRAIAEAMKRALSDGSLRRALGDSAFQTLARECDPSSNVAKYLDIANRFTPKRNRVTVEETVAVIIPVYNSHRYLDQTLHSVRHQVHRPTKIIIVDDGSNDPATIRALDALQGVTLIRQDNRGLSEARNAGLQAAEGMRWVLMLDSDDLLEPTFLSKAFQALRANPDVCMVTAPMMCFHDEDPERRLVYVPLGFDRISLPVWNCAGPSIALIERNTLIELGGYDAAFDAYEDWDLWCRFAQAGERAIILPDFLILNRIRSESMLRTLSRDRADMLRMSIQSKYPDLSTDQGLTARILHGELLTRARAGEYADGHRIAQGIMSSNLRYRIADRVNLALQRMGIQGFVKRLLTR